MKTFSIFLFIFLLMACTKAPVSTTPTTTPSSQIIYPKSSPMNGTNLLDSTTFVYHEGSYGLSASIPSGQFLKVKVAGEYNWYFAMNSGNWLSSDWDNTDFSRYFYTNNSMNYDMQIYLSINPQSNKGKQILIYIYENNSTTPTRTKLILIN